MPTKIDQALRGRAARLVSDHLQEFPTLTAACLSTALRRGVCTASVRHWVRQAQDDAGDRPGVSSDESAEIKRLKAENRRLREDVESLRASATTAA